MNITTSCCQVYAHERSREGLRFPTLMGSYMDSQRSCAVDQYGISRSAIHIYGSSGHFNSEIWISLTLIHLHRSIWIWRPKKYKIFRWFHWIDLTHNTLGFVHITNQYAVWDCPNSELKPMISFIVTHLFVISVTLTFVSISSNNFAVTLAHGQDKITTQSLYH